MEQPADDIELDAQAQKLRVDNARKTFVDDIRWLVSSPRGRRLVWWILGKAGVNRTSFNNSGSVMAFNEGQRNIGLMLQGEVLDANAEAYMTMLQEHRHK